MTKVQFYSSLPSFFSDLLRPFQTAGAIIVEVRRQFEANPGLRDGTVAADSDACIEISTRCSIQEMILPGIYAVFAPATIGFLVGPDCLAGLLGGSIASGMMLATMMANGGGAWDNAKKYIEIEGAHGGKGTDVHKACIVGDTVGDPFKDTSGPALNILIKLMSIVALTVAPSIKGSEDWDNAVWGLIPLSIMVLATCCVRHFLRRKEMALESESKNVSFDVFWMEILELSVGCSHFSTNYSVWSVMVMEVARTIPLWYKRILSPPKSAS